MSGPSLHIDFEGAKGFCDGSALTYLLAHLVSVSSAHLLAHHLLYFHSDIFFVIFSAEDPNVELLLEDIQKEFESVRA